MILYTGVHWQWQEGCGNGRFVYFLCMPTLGETIPVLQVRDVVASVDFYEEKLGFMAIHHEDGFAIVRRGGAQINLTRANDERWRERSRLAQRPVVSGAESFLAGTG